MIKDLMDVRLEFEGSDIKEFDSTTRLVDGYSVELFP